MAQTKEEKLEAQVAELKQELAAERERSSQHVEAYGKSQDDLGRVQAELAAEQQAHADTRAILEKAGTLVEQASTAPSPELVKVTDKKSGLEHELPQRVLDELGAVGKKQFKQDVDKPADLQ